MRKGKEGREEKRGKEEEEGRGRREGKRGPLSEILNTPLNGGELLEQPISTNSVPRAFFPRVAIGCRLLGGVIIGGYMR